MGSLVAQILALPSLLGTARAWKILLLLEIPLPVLLLGGSVFFSESPKFLYIAKNNRKASSVSIQRYYGNKTNLENVLDDFAAEAAATGSNEDTSSSFVEIIKTPYLRRALFVSVFTNIICMTNGFVLRTLYSATTLRRMSISDSLVEILVICIAALL